MINLYVDGGVIERNPSKVGGTWAWCAVDEGKIVASDYGMVTPRDTGLDVVSNNYTELLAAVQAMESIPEDEIFEGKIYTDSGVTQYRLDGSIKYNGIPDDLRRRAVFQVFRLKPKTQLLAGHPSKKDLASGRRAKDGMMVSEWNVWCDKRCNETSRLFLTLLDVKTAEQWHAWQLTVSSPEEWWIGVENETSSGVFTADQKSSFQVLFDSGSVPVWLWHARKTGDAMQAWHKRNGWEPWKEM